MGIDDADNFPPVIYVGDTVADMFTVQKAQDIRPNLTWIGVGVLPPHVQETVQKRDAYVESLKKAGAKIVLSNVQELTTDTIQELI